MNRAMIDGANNTTNPTGMLPVGYLAKRISARTEYLENPEVNDIYSVSGCISKNFADYIPFWKHNRYWFFDSPEIIRQLCIEHSFDLNHTRLFYYEMYNLEFDEDENWEPIEFKESFDTNVREPKIKKLEGFDVVSFSCGTSAECSPLSCNNLAKKIAVNKHCLLPGLERAMELLEKGEFQNAEPGPYRILAVYSLPWP